MRFPPQDLTIERLRDALASGWGIGPASLDYFPEGGGSHHWRAFEEAGSTHFVTVDDLDDKDWLGGKRDEVFAGLRSALECARALREQAGLDFVVAPRADEDGDILRRMDRRYAVSVFPLYAGHSHPFGPYSDRRLRDVAIDMVAKLHRATPSVRGRARLHMLRYGGQDELAAFTAAPNDPWRGGPFSEPARLMLVEHLSDVVELVRGFDHLAHRTEAARDETVITHGEPHPANLLTVDGHVMLVDWDTAALAPPERDLALICPEPDACTARYESATGHTVNFEVIALYQLRWYLDDLASAVRMFRNPHGRNPDTERWWSGLVPRLSQLPTWLRRLG